MIDKEKLVSACLALITQRRSSLEAQLAQLRESQVSDTKSSAGDKHETGREMIAQEIGKIDNSLGNLQKMEEDLARVKIDDPSDRIAFGSLISTDTLHLFLATPLGKVEVEDIDVMVISTAAPLAQAFLGMSKGSSISFNGLEHEVVQLQ